MGVPLPDAFVRWVLAVASGRAFRCNLFTRTSQKGYPLQSLTLTSPQLAAWSPQPKPLIYLISPKLHAPRPMLPAPRRMPLAPCCPPFASQKKLFTANPLYFYSLTAIRHLEQSDIPPPKI